MLTTRLRDQSICNIPATGEDRLRFVWKCVYRAIKLCCYSCSGWVCSAQAIGKHECQLPRSG